MDHAPPPPPSLPLVPGFLDAGGGGGGVVCCEAVITPVSSGLRLNIGAGKGRAETQMVCGAIRYGADTSGWGRISASGPDACGWVLLSM